MCKRNVRTSLVVSRLQQGCNQMTGIMDSKNLIFSLPGNLPEKQEHRWFGKKNQNFYDLKLIFTLCTRILITSFRQNRTKASIEVITAIVIVLLTSSKSNFRFRGFFSSLCWDFRVMVHRLNVSYFIINLWQTWGHCIIIFENKDVISVFKTIQ